MGYTYCKKCGYLSHGYTSGDDPKDSCYCCKSPMYYIPIKELKEKSLLTDEDKELIREKYVKTSPEFDQYLYYHREEILADKHKKNEQIIEMAKAATAKPKVECPYCHSTDTAKISAASKAGSVFFFGLFSQKVKHQWHCNKCGSDF